jgi:hypothetical protein
MLAAAAAASEVAGSNPLKANLVCGARKGPLILRFELFVSLKTVERFRLRAQLKQPSSTEDHTKTTCSSP